MREHGPSFSLVAIIMFVMTVLLNNRLENGGIKIYHLMYTTHPDSG